MLDLARHIVNQKTADFEPENFEDHYEQALLNSSMRSVVVRRSVLGRGRALITW
jgi:non-homologous end joining protein Ku